MAARPRPPIAPHQLQGLKYFANVSTLLARLRPIATERDRAGNRDLFCDQYIGLLLIYFFNTIVTSLRALQQISELEKVEGLLGVGRVSLGSLSEATASSMPECSTRSSPNCVEGGAADTRPRGRGAVA